MMVLMAVTVVCLSLLYDTMTYAVVLCQNKIILKNFIAIGLLS